MLPILIWYYLLGYLKLGHGFSSSVLYNLNARGIHSDFTIFR